MFDFFGKGKQIEIKLEKESYSQGETIVGKVQLKLKKPTKARTLRLDFWGEQKYTKVSRSSGSQTTIRHIFDFRKDLDSEKEYQNQEYSFQIKTPKLAQIDSNQRMAMDAVSSIASSLLTGKLDINRSQEQINWFLKISVDIPMGMDISKKIQVNIV